jgi:flagellin-like hook-associated protein FlgL
VETAELVKGRILEKAASAVLAQANQLPALLLSLLEG